MTSLNEKNFAVLVHWIKERELIRVKKEAGKVPPWTEDPILGKYRFCNVDRCDDRVTRWIFANWLHKYSGQKDLWFAMAVARLLNNPYSLAEVKPAVFNGSGRVRWNAETFVKILHYLKVDGAKIFNPAYIVSTNGLAMDKVEYLAERVLTPLWGGRKEAEAHMGSLEEFHGWLCKFDGLGSFMAAQVVADIKYDEACPLRHAPDWEDWAASGPGSRRGLNWVLGQPFDAPYSERRWREDFQAVLLPAVRKEFPKMRAKLTGQNVQNCLCELFKNAKVLEGLGTPKQLYRWSTT